MNKFLVKISFFILPILIGLYPLDYIVSKYLAESKTYALGELSDWKDIYSGKVNSDLVIYGSSRAWVQISPRILKDILGLRSYNLGIDGHNFWLQYLRHKELLRYNKKPKIILMSVDIFTLQKRNDLYNYQQFLSFLLWNGNLKKFTSSYVGFSFFDYYVPLLRYFGEREAIMESLENLFNLSNKDYSKLVRVKGYRGMDLKWSNDLDKAKSKNDYYKIKFDSPTLKLFELFLNESQLNNIKVILVYPPEYIEGQKFIENRDEVISIYQNMAEKFHIQFLNYSKDNLCNQRHLFYNAEHLNKYGAQIFTKKLGEDLKWKFSH